MDQKDPDAYVAGLLRQLEELKRQKARKLQKLRRLGKRTTKQASASKEQPQNSSETSTSNVQNASLRTFSQENKTDQLLFAVNCLQCSAVVITSDKYCNLCKASLSNENTKKGDTENMFPLKPSNFENVLVSVQPGLKSSTKCTEKEEASLNSIAEVHVSALCDENTYSIQEHCINSSSISDISESCFKKVSGKLKESIALPDKITKDDVGSEAKSNTNTNCEKITFLQEKVPVDSNSTSSLPKTHCRDASKSHRKRLTSASEEINENCQKGAKKIRVSGEFKQVLVGIECNGDGSEGAAFEQNGAENLIKAGNKNTCDKVPETVFPETESILILDENKNTNNHPVDGMDDSMATMACFLSGSFAAEEDAVIEVVDIKSETNGESLPKVVNKDDSGSEKVPSNNSISFSSMKFSSPFSDELSFPATAIENLSTKQTSKIMNKSSDSVNTKVIDVDQESFDVVNINFNQNRTTNCPESDEGLKRVMPNSTAPPVQSLTSDSKKIQLPMQTVEVSDATLKKDFIFPSFSKHSDLDSSAFKKPVSEASCVSKDIQLIHVDDLDEIDDNLTPSLLDSTPHLQLAVKEERKETNLMPVLKQPVFEQATVDISNDECSNALDNKALATEFDSLSLVAVDTVEDTLLVPHEHRTASMRVDGHGFKVPSVPQTCSLEDSEAELLDCDSELFTIPETEMLAPSLLKSETHIPNPNINSKKKADVRKLCDVTNNFVSTSFSHLNPQVPNREDSKTIDASCSLNKPEVSIENNDICDMLDDSFSDSFSDSLTNILEHYDVHQDSVTVEDTLELGNYRNIPILKSKNDEEDNTPAMPELSEDDLSMIKFAHCMHSEIREPVSDVKIAFFNSNYYMFIQHTTWVQVWRQEDNDWNKIFCHEIEDAFQLKEMCFSKNDAHLALVMLLCNEQGHCLQFVLFEKEVGVIKLMEQTHWLQNRCPGESVLLCGLESLRFATAQGKENFEVFVHAFSCLESNPKLLMASLGHATGELHSLCKMEKLPNALMGTSSSMLFVWHLLETRLVTSVCLQPLDILPIERCIWAIIENGLVFFLTVCTDNNSPNMGQLFVANLATGFCQLVTPYSMIPATESTHFIKKNLKAAYSEPFLLASCNEGGFLWSVHDEYCCAALGQEANITAITIMPQSDELFTIALGNSEGSVTCYNLKYT